MQLVPCIACIGLRRRMSSRMAHDGIANVWLGSCRELPKLVTEMYDIENMRLGTRSWPGRQDMALERDCFKFGHQNTCMEFETLRFPRNVQDESELILLLFDVFKEAAHT
eukprot:TRINITY_DN107451_c0_g1_i1.p1 TRINITY_DN107451_c0_g1~~TRINITY_DN107451_c0_g1_i1.p1  ORF type:complete len:110 (+),score=15.24 TRINITY_DN107451_c0_g1_i1:407-736(+)